MGSLTAHCQTTVLFVLLLPEQHTTLAFKDVTEESVGEELGVTCWCDKEEITASRNFLTIEKKDQAKDIHWKFSALGGCQS